MDGFNNTLSERENDIDTQLGILEQNKKEFEIYKQSEIGKYANKEVSEDKEKENG